MCEVNFDSHLLRFYNEVVYWTKQGFEIPYSKDVLELAANADKMRIVREQVRGRGRAGGGPVCGAQPWDGAH